MENLKKESKLFSKSIDPDEIICIKHNYFGETLKELRLERKHTQKEVADLLGITQAQWSAYELGKNRPGIDAIIEIAKKLKIHPLALLGKSLDKSKYYNDSYKQLSFHEYERIVDEGIETYRERKLNSKVSVSF